MLAISYMSENLLVAFGQGCVPVAISMTARVANDSALGIEARCIEICFRILFLAVSVSFVI